MELFALVAIPALVISWLKDLYF